MATQRTVVVTGGSMGIGREIAAAFAAEGDRLVICARGEEALRETASLLAGSAGEIETAVCDLRDGDRIRELVADVRARHGGIDILVNNAGVYGPIGPLVENDLEAWCETIDINLLGVVRMTRAVLPGMIERRRGVVINLSGGGATGPKPGYSAYAASKTAVVRLTEVLAHELEPHGIRVNAIAPGFVATRLHQQTLSAGELAPDHDKVADKLSGGGDDPGLAARLALFLASDAAEGISGRLLSSVWDDWQGLAGRGAEVAASDLFTLRRIDDMFFRQVEGE